MLLSHHRNRGKAWQTKLLGQVGLGCHRTDACMHLSAITSEQPEFGDAVGPTEKHSFALVEEYKACTAVAIPLPGMNKGSSQEQQIAIHEASASCGLTEGLIDEVLFQDAMYGTAEGMKGSTDGMSHLTSIRIN